MAGPHDPFPRVRTRARSRATNREEESETAIPKSRTHQVPIAVLALWLALVNTAGFFTWGAGPTTFASLSGMVAVLLLLHRRSAIVPPADDPTSLAHVVSDTLARRLLAILVAGGLVWTCVWLLDGFFLRPNHVIDVGENTYVAARHFLDGANPYTSKAQVAHTVEAGPHVELSAEGTRMFGIPYHYGYPYFPGMFLPYAAVALVVRSLHALRVTNVLLMAANVAGIWFLAQRLAVLASRRRIAGLVALGAYLGVAVYAHELFVFGVVDVLLSTFALYGFVALSHRRFGLAGALLGAAQACKLLPAPLLLLPVLVVLGGRAARAVAAGYAVVALALILPFLLPDPGAFLSATILYYLTHHAGGDDSSLWYFLPSPIQTPFWAAGLVLALVALLAPVVRRRLEPRMTCGTEPGEGAFRRRVLDALTGAFCSYVVLMAFSSMTHLNYLWAVYPLGCVALAALS